MNDDSVLLKWRVDNLEERCKKLETEYENFDKRLNEYDKTQETIMLQLKYIQEKLDEVSKKQDKILSNPTPQQTLNEEKASNWNKIIATIITSVVGAIVGAIIALILK